MSSETAQQLEAVPRTFAEFSAQKSWSEILDHARRLHGAKQVGLFGQGAYESWVSFNYQGYDFAIVESDSRCSINVDDSTCDYLVLHEVQRHFAALLSPDLSD
jgi:hypothetical protein